MSAIAEKQLEEEKVDNVRTSRSKTTKELPSFDDKALTSASSVPVAAPAAAAPRNPFLKEDDEKTRRFLNRVNRYVQEGDSPRLKETLRDFYRLLASLPVPVVRIVPKVVARVICRILAARGIMASDYAFDLAMLFWRLIINIFFRSIQPRGAWRIPKNKEGPIIFVGAPHHNQFLDPLLLSSEVRRASGRRVAFLTAEKSLKRRFVGAAARLMHSIPVARAADSAKKGAGRIKLHSSGDAHLIEGVGTQFKKQLQIKGQLCLPKEYGHATAEVTEIISDTECRIKKEFKDVHGKAKVLDGLRKEGGVEYTCLPYVDQTQMYASVYEKLAEGGSLGIFPEGGSHDRTDLLPLKAGVVIMALGAMAANPGLKVRIVPVGLSYFHPHKFRSRAVVEFGAPLDVPPEMVQLFGQGGDSKKKAVGQMMEIVFDGLKSVTVRAPDYETLMFIQAVRRLYVPHGQHTTLGQVVELNRKFIVGYQTFKDEPRVQKAKDDVNRYNVKLRYAGLKDHQVERATRAGWKSLGLLVYRVGLLFVWGGFALPGVILNSPIFILAKIISYRKAKEALAASQVKLKGRDVLATWKVLVSLVVAPILYTFYAGVATYFAHRFKLPFKHQLLMPIYAMAAQPAIAWSTIRFGEVGLDIYKSLPPLFISLLPGNHKVIQDLQNTRSELAAELHSIIEEFAPKIWHDFDQKRIFPASAQVKRSTSDNSSSGAPDENVLSHPLSWLDDRLFGWNTSGRRKSASSSKRKSVVSAAGGDEGRGLGDLDEAGETRSGSTTEDESDDDDASSYETDEGDYETVFGMLKAGVENAQNGGSRSRSRSRKRSHSRRASGESFAERRSRSQNDFSLSALSPLEQKSNPFNNAEGMTSALESSSSAATRRTRTHSLTEDVSADDLKSEVQGTAKMPFEGASAVLEAKAPTAGQGKQRPPLDQIPDAADTPTGADSPKRS